LSSESTGRPGRFFEEIAFRAPVMAEQVAQTLSARQKVRQSGTIGELESARAA
jgi:hypothetical protein